MSTDENYWDRIKETNLEDGYYWYRDMIGAEPEIVKSFMKRPDHKFFSNVEKQRHIEFCFDYSESYSMTIEEILSQHSGAQISVERIRPPNEQA